MKINWKIHYRFYDPAFKDDPGIKGVEQVVIKRMNKFQTLAERQCATRALIDSELDMLLNYQYNPITGFFVEPEEVHFEIDPKTPFVSALKEAKKKLNKAKSTLSDISSVITGIEKAANKLRFESIPISQITRKHIKALLSQCASSNSNWSANRFNKYRSYLMMLFNELIELEATEIDPVSKIKKQKTVKKMRETLTLEERKKINEHLRRKNYSFWRFTHIFFHSGARESEMMLIKKSDVDLLNRRYRVVVNKGVGAREEWRPIKEIIHHLWEEVMNEAKSSDFLFSKGLKPGQSSISASQITRRWRVHVKAPIARGGLNISADFYSLKHSNLDEIAAALNVEDASRMAGHTSTVITMQHYLGGEKERQADRLRRVKNEF